MFTSNNIKFSPLVYVFKTRKKEQFIKLRKCTSYK